MLINDDTVSYTDFSKFYFNEKVYIVYFLLGSSMINNNVNAHVSLELYFVINIIHILGHSQRNKFN